MNKIADSHRLKKLEYHVWEDGNDSTHKQFRTACEFCRVPISFDFKSVIDIARQLEKFLDNPICESCLLKISGLGFKK